MNKTEKQIDRITQMEQKLDQLQGVTAEVTAALDHFIAVQGEVKKLAAYYGSSAWHQDVSDDEFGLFPGELKRGVLSEDAAYNALTEYRGLYLRMIDIVSNALHKGTI